MKTRKIVGHPHPLHAPSTNTHTHTHTNTHTQSLQGTANVFLFTPVKLGAPFQKAKPSLQRECAQLSPSVLENTEQQLCKPPKFAWNFLVSSSILV